MLDGRLFGGSITFIRREGMLTSTGLNILPRCPASSSMCKCKQWQVGELSFDSGTAQCSEDLMDELLGE